MSRTVMNTDGDSPDVARMREKSGNDLDREFHSLARIPSLDGFRALSIGLVLLAHCMVTIGFPSSLRSTLSRVIDGASGVRVFFVISGFLITTLLLREEAKTGAISLKHFFARRAVRILPVYWTFLIATFVLNQVYRFGTTPMQFARAFTFTTGVAYWDNWPLSHTWSLAVEEQFYILWPFFFSVSPRRVRLGVALVGVCLGPFVRFALYSSGNGWACESTALGHFDALMMGCFAALSFWDFPAETRRLLAVKPRLLQSVAVAVFLAVVAMRNHPCIAVPIGGTLQALCATYFISYYCTPRRNVIFTALNSRFVTLLGVLSYSVYIWQQLYLYPRVDGYEPAVWQRFPQNLLLAIVTAFASYYLIEQPFLKLKRRQVIA